MRKTIGKKKDEDAFDFSPLTSKTGVTLLKFGRAGPAREKVFTLSNDRKLLSWDSQWFCWKLGRTNTIAMDKVRMVQKGQKTKQFLRLKHVFGVAEDKSLSLIYKDSNGAERSLDLMCPNKEGFKYIYSAFKKIVADYAEEKRTNDSNKDKQYLRAMWNQADSDHNGSLTKDEIIKLVQFMNINMSTVLVKDMFKRVDVDGNGSLDYSEFCNFMEMLKKRPEFDTLWLLALDGGDSKLSISFEDRLDIREENLTETEKRSTVGVDAFVAFWNKCQSKPLSLEQGRELVLKHIPDKYEFDEGDAIAITHNIWLDIFAGSGNELFDADFEKEHCDMDRPISHYYIDSSYATCLSGNQLMGRSTVQRYQDSLLAGVRCIDAKIWDGDKGEPIVFHGHGITGKILLVDVLKTIVESGFAKSQYPVILCLHNHCSAKVQLRVVQLLKSTLKKLLALPGGDGMLASPKALRGLVLLRCAKSEAGDNEEDDEGAPGKKKSAASTVKSNMVELIPELAQLCYFNVEHGDYASMNPDRTSVAEDTIWRITDSEAAGLIIAPDRVDKLQRYHNLHIGAVTPNGSRMDSSNYDPMLGWVGGQQLVCMNQQTSDVFMRMYRGRFRENGGCGYVLKPDYMLGLSSKPSPVKITINILGAHQLPKPSNSSQGEVIDPFVVISIHGQSGDNARYQTKTVLDNGFNPQWNEVVVFNVANPSLAMLSMEIYDEDVTTSEFVAYTAMPVRCISCGIRSCKLFDQFGRQENDFEYATLSVRVAIDTVA